MANLTPDQIEALAESISHHAEAKHLDEFNVGSRQEMVGLIKDMLSDPDTEFIINTSNDPNYKDSVSFCNSKTQSILVFNPQQLEDPKPNADPKSKMVRDNFAGTFYKAHTLNDQGEPISKRNGRALNTRDTKDAFKDGVRALKGKLVETGVPKEDIKPQRIGDSQEWAKPINDNDKKIRDGLEKGIARKHAHPDINKPTVATPTGPANGIASNGQVPNTPGVHTQAPSPAFEGLRRVGVAGGIIAGLHLLSEGKFAEAAESFIPGASSATAALEGRLAEAGMSGAEEAMVTIPITETLRPLLREYGVDLNPGILEGIVEGIKKSIGNDADPLAAINDVITKYDLNESSSPEDITQAQKELFKDCQTLPETMKDPETMEVIPLEEALRDPETYERYKTALEAQDNQIGLETLQQYSFLEAMKHVSEHVQKQPQNDPASTMTAEQPATAETHQNQELVGAGTTHSAPGVG
ncbi:MAG: hypothetical protein DHS20C02_03350 [Micavibrio sp.]|nr:MAG: hypothetical protein DHS20C02_03350 [Micavibrio sp.]